MTKKKSTRKRAPAGPRARRGRRRAPGAGTRSRWPVAKRVALYSLLTVFVFSLIYTAWLNIRLIDRFSGRIWSIPARVYARPLELYAGKPISPEALLSELQYLNYTRVEETPASAARFRQRGGSFEVRTRPFRFRDGFEDSRAVGIAIAGDAVQRMTDLDSGQDVALLRFDPVYLTGIFPAHGEDRVLVRLQDVPEIFVEMLVAVEDHRFMEHHGIDPRSIGRALLTNIQAGKTVQGGSTLTQQLVKNMFLSSEKSLWRKANEAVMSLLLELQYSKALILETYINEVYLGQDGERAIHGFGLASEFYFGKPLTELDTGQLALLVGMVKGASWYNPARYPERARERRNTVLDVAAAHGIVPEAQAARLKSAPVTVQPRAHRSRYPAFVDLVKRQLRNDYDPDDLRSEGLQIFTTLDPLVQAAAEKAVTSVLPGIDFSGQTLQAAAVVVAPGSGEVLAMIGDRQPDYPGFNRALDARRHIGSLMKPVVYLTALRRHDRYTLATMLSDTRLRVQGGDGKIWEPQNYDREYHGEVILYESLLKSYNIPAARLGLELGLAEIAKTFEALGGQTALPSYPSVTLGAVELSPFEVAGVYQSLAANGFHSPLRSVRAVLDKDGMPLTRYQLDASRDVDAAAVALVNFVLHRVTREGTARQLSAELDFDVAGKTGTSDNLHDSWFAGFSASHLAVVWVGHDDQQPTGLTGSSGAMRVWSRLFSGIQTRPWATVYPPGVSLHWIDRTTGKLTGRGCENAVELPFIDGTEPTSSTGCGQSSPLDWLKNIFE